MSSQTMKPAKSLQKASELRKWMDSIRAKNKDGVVKRVDVVHAARDPKSIGHRYFTWDDSKAAEKCRLMEAGQLIRKVYTIETTEGAKQPAYVSLLPDRERPGGGYRATADVLSSKALRAQLELTAKAELRGWTERYKMLTNLVRPVIKAAGLDGPVQRKPK